MFTVVFIEISVKKDILILPFMGLLTPSLEFGGRSYNNWRRRTLSR